jgi:hypothetical protein
MEQIIDWLNENENRAFPFVEESNKSTSGGWALADNVVLDAQIIYLNKEIDRPVFLRKINATSGANGGTLTLEFGSSTVTAVSFVINAPNNRSYPLYIREQISGSLLVVSEEIKNIPILNQNLQVTAAIPVEPSVCYEFKDAWLGVSSVDSFPNSQTSANSIAPFLPLTPDTTSAELTGHVYFLEGYNFRVNIDTAINLSIGREFGLQMDCTTSFVQAEFLDCDSVISYINGIPPDAAGNFRLLSGDNVNIVSGVALDEKIEDLYETAPDARNHSLFVGLTFETTDLCAPINIVPTIE